MKIIVLLALCVHCPICAQVTFPYNDTTELFDSYKGDTCIDSITEDSMTDTYYVFDVIKKKRKMLYVDICAPNWDNKDSSNVYSCKYSKQAWVRITDTKIYGRICEGGVYLFYTKPKYQAKQISINVNDICDYFRVVDVHGSWVKVLLLYNGKKYKLWMPPESQCISITNECM